MPGPYDDDDAENGHDEAEDLLDESPAEADLERFGGATVTCPECGAELYDDSEVCWKCGHALRSQSPRPPVWVLIAAALVIIALLYFAIR